MIKGYSRFFTEKKKKKRSDVSTNVKPNVVENMTKDELMYLFKKYLNREFSEKEWEVHGKKNKKIFEKEIANCDEYKRIISGNHNEGTKLKIAILLTGHVRKHNIIPTLLKFCGDYDYDVFVHTWDNLGMKGTETNLSAKNEEKKIRGIIENIPNIKNFIIENNKEFIKNINRKETYFNFSSPEEFIKSQLYSINKCFNLMHEHSIKENIDYRMVIKLRFDCEIMSFSIDEGLLNDINNYNIIFTPNNDCGHPHMDNATSCWACDNMYYKFNLKNVHVFEHTNVICDIFAYGSLNSMFKYCEIYNHYDDILKEYVEINKDSLEKNKIKHTYSNGVYHVDKSVSGHINSLYYLYCSYPERLIQKFLNNYMLVESRKIKLKFIR